MLCFDYTGELAAMCHPCASQLHDSRDDAASASSAVSSLRGKRWPYVSIVTVIEECPHRYCTLSAVTLIRRPSFD